MKLTVAALFISKAFASHVGMAKEYPYNCAIAPTSGGPTVDCNGEACCTFNDGAARNPAIEKRCMTTT